MFLYLLSVVMLLAEHSGIDPELAQDGSKRTSGEVTPAMPGDDGEPIIGRVASHFVGTRRLTNKLTSQLAQSPGQLSVVHGTVNQQ